MTGVPIKGNLDTDRHTHSEKTGKETHREDNYLQAKETDLEQIILHGPHLTLDTWILDVWPSACEAINVCCWRPKGSDIAYIS